VRRWSIPVALVVAGCGSGAPGPRAQEPGALRSIGYATLACYGTCPVYRVTIHPDGRGVYFGENHVRATGSRPFRI